MRPLLFMSVCYQFHLESQFPCSFQVLLAVIEEEALAGIQFVAREQNLVDAWVGLLHFLDTRDHDAVKQLEKVKTFQRVMESLGRPVGQAIEPVPFPLVQTQPCHIPLYGTAQAVGKVAVVTVDGF